jgi:hypothetical protein
MEAFQGSEDLNKESIDAPSSGLVVSSAPLLVAPIPAANANLMHPQF